MSKEAGARAGPWGPVLSLSTDMFTRVRGWLELAAGHPWRAKYEGLVSERGEPSQPGDDLD